MEFSEIKHNVAKQDEVYICNLIWRDSWRAVLSYLTDRDYSIFDGFTLPVGSLTLGCYWSGKGYIMWEMYGPDRKLRGYYFHICSPPCIGRASLEYLDLVIDVWFFPDGSFRFLDREELWQLSFSGSVDRALAIRAEEEAKGIVQNFGRITTEGRSLTMRGGRT